MSNELGSDELGVAREHSEVSEWDAAYVLGALTPADRRRYERHVDTCARCRTAVAELSGLPGLLADVPLSQVVESENHDDDLPEDLLPRLSAAVARGRRRSRVRYGVLGGLVAAAAVVIAVVASWPSTPAGPTPSPTTRTSSSAPVVAANLALQPVVPNPLAVDVAFVQEPWGTRLNLRCQFAGDGGDTGPEKTYSYTLFATNRAGKTMQVGGWTYGPDTVAEPVGTSNWPVSQIASVEVRNDDGTVLLRGTR